MVADLCVVLLSAAAISAVSGYNIFTVTVETRMFWLITVGSRLLQQMKVVYVNVRLFTLYAVVWNWL